MLRSYYGEYISQIQHNAVIIVFLITFVILISMINVGYGCLLIEMIVSSLGADYHCALMSTWCGWRIIKAWEEYDSCTI